jgi:phosphotransferase system  glucose/maltose/N-acetylglucosamine-specific IIC component
VEELIVALSGYGIVFALGVGVVDLLTDGQLTTQLPWVDYAYAVAFAAAIAGQIIGLSSRSSRSFGRGNWFGGISYSVLVLLLAFTEYQASVIFGFHKAFGTPVIQSIQQLGISESQFIELRAGVGVFLAVLSGYLRWQPTKRKSIAQMQREADYKRQADAIKAQQRANGLQNLAGLAGNVGQAARAAVKNATATTAQPPQDIASANDPAGSGDEDDDVKKK